MKRFKEGVVGLALVSGLIGGATMLASPAEAARIENIFVCNKEAWVTGLTYRSLRAALLQFEVCMDR